MIELHVNGQDHSYDGDPSVPLLWVLRDELGLTGTKFGCGHGLCGACTVHLGGEAVRSCSVQAQEAAGKPVVTIEGLDPHGNHPVQRRPHPAEAADDARTNPLAGWGSQAGRGERIEHSVNIQVAKRHVKKNFQDYDDSQENRQPAWWQPRPRYATRARD